MLPFIIGGAVLAVGAYLLNDASEENREERRRYDDEYESYSKTIKKHQQYAQNRDYKDKLYKMKRAKAKVADNIYKEYTAQNNHFHEINQALVQIKHALDRLFAEKKATHSKEEKRNIQQQINQVIEARKELFLLKDSLKASVHQLKKELRIANAQTRKLKEEIAKIEVETSKNHNRLKRSWFE